MRYTSTIMLRRTLVGLGIFIVLLQFPGFPHDIIRWLSMLSGLAIIFLLVISKGGAKHAADDTSEERELTITRLGRKKFVASELFDDKV